MLDFLYGLGQVLSLIALVSGLILTIRHREPSNESRSNTQPLQT